jgi:DNA polymerase-3 subunit alpha
MYLNCHSYYSLRFGTFSEVELLELAIENNVNCIALTDINNTSACMNFVQQAKKQNIKPILEMEIPSSLLLLQKIIKVLKISTAIYLLF